MKLGNELPNKTDVTGLSVPSLAMVCSWIGEGATGEMSQSEAANQREDAVSIFCFIKHEYTRQPNNQQRQQ